MAASRRIARTRCGEFERCGDADRAAQEKQVLLVSCGLRWCPLGRRHQPAITLVAAPLRLQPTLKPSMRHHWTHRWQVPPLIGCSRTVSCAAQRTVHIAPCSLRCLSWRRATSGRSCIGSQRCSSCRCRHYCGRHLLPSLKALLSVNSPRSRCFSTCSGSRLL